MTPPVYVDMTGWPTCTNDGCGTDHFGPYHGINCARSRHAAEQLRNHILEASD